jgi:adenylate kinase family enzyme
VNGLIISGPPGSGKTTLAAALAPHIPRCVHLQTDWFYAAIKTGYVEPWLAAAEQQNRTVVQAAAQAAVEYARGGYFVVLDGVVLPWAREIYDAAMRAEQCELAFLVLLPSPEETTRRGMSRRIDHGLTPEVYAEMHRQFAEVNFDAELVLDPTALSVEELVVAAKHRVALD